MHVSDFDKKRFLSGSNVDGKRLRVTITAVYAETIGDDEREKAVMAFSPPIDGIHECVINVTNLRVLAAAFGADMTKWVNKQVILFGAPTQFSGKPIVGLRMGIPKAVAVAPPQPAVDSNFDDDIEM